MILSDKMITKKEIIKEIENFNIPKGKIVTVHTSLKKVGEIEGGGETLLSSLVEVFTKDGGILCVPTHTWDSDIYDLRKSESCIGTLPRLAASHKDAFRTLHPTHSMAVFGEEERVKRFIENEEKADTPANPKGCYGKIYEEDGYVILIGVGHDKNTYIHFVEELLGVPDRLTEEKAEKTIIHKDGREEKRYLYWFDEAKIPDVSVYFPKFEPAFRYHSCIEDAALGNAPVQICSARKMKEVIELIYSRNSMKELLDNDRALDEKLYKGNTLYEKL